MGLYSRSSSALIRDRVEAVEEVGTEKASCGEKKGLKGGAGTYLEGPLRILVA